MDNLKNYLREHREGLDADSPRDGLWQDIQGRRAPIRPRQIIVIRRMVRYIAAACLLALIGIGVKRMIKDRVIQPEKELVKEGAPIKKEPTRRDRPAITGANDTGRMAVASNDTGRRSLPVRKHRRKPVIPSVPADADPLLTALEKNYTQLVNAQLKTLQRTPVLAEGPDYFSGFKAQLRQFDADEAAVRNDIRNNGLNDNLLEQLINVYQQKLNVLKNLRSEITNMNNRVKGEKPGSGPLNAYYLHL